MRISLLNFLLMFTIAALVAALVAQRFRPELFSGARKEPTEIHVWSFGHPSRWHVDEDLLDSTPSWGIGDENPPLSNKAALVIADEVLIKLSEASAKSSRWELASIGLVSLRKRNGEKWCYAISYRGYEVPVHRGEPETFTALVLMDGQVVIPRSYNDAGIANVLQKQFEAK